MNNATTPFKKDEGRQGNVGQFGSELKTKAQETGASVVDKAAKKPLSHACWAGVRPDNSETSALR